MKGIINGLWIGNKLSFMSQSCIQSWLDLGYEFRLWVYEPVVNVPSGVSLYMGDEIMNKEEVYNIAENNHILNSADQFRLMLMYKRGGWYVDLDCFGLSLLTDLESNEIVISTERTMKSGAYKSKLDYRVSNQMLYSKNTNEKLWLDLYNLMNNKMKLNEKLGEGHKMGKLEGMKIICKVDNWIKKGKYTNIKLLCPSEVCNLDWWNTNEYFNNKPIKKKWGVEPNLPLEQGYAIHLWHSLATKKSNINLPVENSCYDRLTKNHQLIFLDQ